jgi:hypothetical protein
MARLDAIARRERTSRSAVLAAAVEAVTGSAAPARHRRGTRPPRGQDHDAKPA